MSSKSSSELRHSKMDDVPIESNPESNGRFDDRLSALPKIKDGHRTDLYLYQGFYYRPFLLRGLMYMQDHFNDARSSDLLIASFPKSGTTWLKALVFAIMNRTKYEKETHPLLSNISHECLPSLEVDIYQDGEPTIPVDNIPSPRLFHTHVPYTSLPHSIIHNDCKIVYIIRDPKDVFISFFHFSSKLVHQMSIFKDAEKVTTIEHEFDLFCKGINVYGPYWDHVLSYWKANLERPQSILFLKYEDLKGDPHFYVKKLAQFLGKPFTSKEKEDGIVEYVVDLCSFEFLSNLQISKTGKYKWNITNDAFYRKGEVGDWRNHLTPDMADHLDQITKQKFDDHGLIL